MIPAYVERDFSFTLDGDRIRGRMDRLDIERLPADSRPVSSPPAALRRDDHADAMSPTLPGLHPERVTITDYKSSDVRDPVRARERARDSLQLQIYAMAYQAETGHLPDALQLWFLESGLVGAWKWTGSGSRRPASPSGAQPAGIRARQFGASPDYISCGYCAFRDICPASAAR